MISIARIQKIVFNPWVVALSIVAGLVFGALAPTIAKHLDFVGDIYVGLLKMTVLPFMLSAIIFSLQKLFREGGASDVLQRVAMVILGFTLGAVLLAGAVMALAEPGRNLPSETVAALGQIVGGDMGSSDTSLNLYGEDAPAKSTTLGQVIVSVIPVNIFSALSAGETLKALIFAMLFGLAVGHVPSGVAGSLTQSLETVYRSCQTITFWLNFPMPIILFCMSASQYANSGPEPLIAMVDFIVAFYLTSGLVIVLALVFMWRRLRVNIGSIIDALKAPFAMAIATRSSASCMPVMVEALVEKLGLQRDRVELLVPLTISLLRVGPSVYYACATLFVAQLYGRSLEPAEWLLVLFASSLAGFASSGMSGLITISLTGMVCGYLGLPFEAAFILFVAIDPVCDVMRTLVIVLGNTAAVTAITPIREARPITELKV